MDFPLTCCSCTSENWVDLEKPILWRLNNLVTLEGYICRTCKARIPFFYTTQAMNDALAKLERKNPLGASFRFLLGKAMKKAKGIRVNHGKS